MIKGVWLLVAALLSVTLPTPSQPTRNGRAQICASELGDALPGILDEGEGRNVHKPDKDAKRGPKKGAERRAAGSSMVRQPLPEVASNARGALGVAPRALAARPRALRHDARRAVRRLRPHDARHRSCGRSMADDDPPRV